MKGMKWMCCLVVLGMLTLGACTNKKESKDKTDDEEQTEQTLNDSVTDASVIPEEEEAETEAASEEESEAEEDEMMTPEQLEAYENEVWTHLGGTYGFVGDGYEWVALETGLGEDDAKWLSLGGEEEIYPVTIDYKTGNIKAYDDDGNLVFDGYCTKGGNMLRGKLRGRDVKFEGACGQ